MSAPNDKPVYQRGDWIMYCRGGLHVSEILYAEKGSHYPWEMRYYTTDHVVNESEILRYVPASEVRDVRTA